MEMLSKLHVYVKVENKQQANEYKDRLMQLGEDIAEYYMLERGALIYSGSSWFVSDLPLSTEKEICFEALEYIIQHSIKTNHP